MFLYSFESFDQVVWKTHLPLQEAIYGHKWAAPWRLLLPQPLFHWLFRPRAEINLAPDTHLPDHRVPVLILHSSNDPVINVELARIEGIFYYEMDLYK